jgi:hypothetical protein
VKALALALLAAGLVAAGASGAAPVRPWLWQCEQIGLEQAKDACYVRLLLLDIDRRAIPRRSCRGSMSVRGRPGRRSTDAATC